VSATFSGRYPAGPSPWAFRANALSNTFAPSQRYGRPGVGGSNTAMWQVWFLTAPDQVTAQTTPYDKGLATLKRWTGAQWVAAALRVRTF